MALRIPILLVSAASLAISACGDGTSSVSDSASAQVDPGTDVSDQDLETRVMAALDDAPRHGLTRDLFLEGDLPAGGAERRQALLGAVKSYASALADGMVDPTDVRDVYTVPRPKVDVSAGLQQALRDNKLGEWLGSLAPQSDEYRALSSAFVELVEQTSGLEGASIPASGKLIRAGESDPRVPAVAQNLRAQGYLPASQPNGDGQPQGEASGQRQQAPVFTQQMAKALAQWQSDSGLKPDGVVGPNTVEQLNSGPRDRARKLAIAMERLRWLEREAPPTRIDVNTAATTLTYYQDGQMRDQRRVVAGEPGWETPQLGSPIYALVANPDWVVPDSIVEDEISKKSASWLRENNFTKKDGRWVQQPGPESALGLVKFAMRNDEAIYLHDTPAKALFNQEERHKSHGCVRVENAVQFAQMIAQAGGISGKFNQAMAKEEETEVALGKEIPVRLLYHTAWLGSDGRVKYAEDVYGWDNDVAVALGYSKRERAKVEHRPSDVGP